MNTNYEQIPTEIFEYLGVFSFDELNETQQEMVLSYMDEDEYAEYAATLQVVSDQVNLNERKEHMLNLYDETYSRSTDKSRYGLLWLKLACVALFLSTGLFAYKWYAQSAKTIVDTVVKHDTIFQEKIIYRDADQVLNPTTNIASSNNIPPNAMRHTSKRNKAFKKPSMASLPIAQVKKRMNYNVVNIQNIELEVVPLSTFSERMNATKRNSKNDDSLERNFQFVSL